MQPVFLVFELVNSPKREKKRSNAVIFKSYEKSKSSMSPFGITWPGFVKLVSATLQCGTELIDSISEIGNDVAAGTENEGE